MIEAKPPVGGFDRVAVICPNPLFDEFDVRLGQAVYGP